MDNALSKIGFLDGTTLKIIAIISMTIDHIGYIFFPKVMILRYIGRLAFPIFAYMIAEGCFYTKDKKKYLSLILGIGIICQIVMIIAMNVFELNIMFTFAASVGIIFLLQWAFGRREIFVVEEGSVHEVDTKGVSAILRWTIFIAFVLFIFLFAVLGPKILSGFKFEYRVYGIFLAPLIYIPKERYQKLIIMALCLIVLSIDSHPFQWFCLFSLVPLIFYSGLPGRYRMKYFFYLYYPLHLALLWAIKLFG